MTEQNNKEVLEIYPNTQSVKRVRYNPAYKVLFVDLKGKGTLRVRGINSLDWESYCEDSSDLSLILIMIGHNTDYDPSTDPFIFNK